MATLQEMERALVAADKAGATEDARMLAAAITQARAAGGRAAQDVGSATTAPSASGFMEKVAALPGQIREAITGEQRATAESQSLPEWTSMPEMNQLSLASAKSGLGTLLSNADETAQILRVNFPDMAQRRDEKGNWIFTSPADGQDYVFRPGLTLGDLPRLLGGIAAFTPAGRSASIVGAGLKSAATQAAIEGTQAATGGDFSAGDVAAAGAFGAAVPLVGGAARYGVGKVRQAMARPPEGGAAAGGPTPPTTPKRGVFGNGAARPEPPPPQDARPAAAPAAVPPAGTPDHAAAAPGLSPEDLGQATRAAAMGGLGSKRATQAVAQEAAPDPEVLAAAKRLGIEDFLQPDHVTTNQAFRELSQVLKSVPGSASGAAERLGLEQVAKRADDLITEIGGTHDLSSLNANLSSRMRATVSELEAKGDDLYKQIREQLPPRTPAPAPSVLAFIEQRAQDLGGAKYLTPLERTVRARLSPKAGEPGAAPAGAVSPSQLSAEVEAASQRGAMVGQGSRQAPPQRLSQPTYALLDDVRKDVGAAARSRGPFKDADTGLAKQLYALLSKDQGAVVGAAGLDDLFQAARQTVGIRKGLEDDMVALFGRELSGSIVGDLSRGVQRLAKGDVAQFTKLVRSVPEEMRQEVVASGLAAAFGKNARSGSISFANYARWYEGLQTNQQAMAALMSNLPPSARQSLGDLYKVSSSISKATRERITTGRLTEGMKAIEKQLEPADTLMARAYEAAAKASGTAAAEAVSSTVGLPGAGLAAGLASALRGGRKAGAFEAADKMFASPDFIRLARAATPEERDAAAKAFARSQGFLHFVSIIGGPRELTTRERWVLQAMQASNAEEQPRWK